jgi:ferredoxin
MCEFCLKHGEGKKWYLQAENYSDDLLSDIGRRRFIAEFFSHPEALAKDAADLERLDRAPSFIRGIIRRATTRKMKKKHFGQVVPIEEIEQIFGFVNSVVRVACICRHVTLGEEKRYCYGISLVPDGGMFFDTIGSLDSSFLSGPDNLGLESLAKEDALSAFHDHEREGLCHTVWTFKTPFIGGVCNCDRSDCLAMRSTVTHHMPVMFRAEYVAQSDENECIGCRECMRVCQFGAISYSAASERIGIDERCCYGCGICRSVCETGAIRLENRANVPAAAGLW